MKKILILSSILLLLAVISRAATNEPALYRANEFSVSGFGTARTSDFNDSKLGLGIGVQYFLTRQFGAELESRWENADNGPDLGISGVYRFPISGTATAPYVFAGGDYALEPDNWGLHLGVGLEHRFTPRFGVFGDARLQKWFINEDNSPSEALARVGVRLTF